MRLVITMRISDIIGNVSTNSIPIEVPDDLGMTDILMTFKKQYDTLTADLKRMYQGKSTSAENTAWYDNMTQIPLFGQKLNYAAVFYAPEFGDPVIKVQTVDEWFTQ